MFKKLKHIVTGKKETKYHVDSDDDDTYDYMNVLTKTYKLSQQQSICNVVCQQWDEKYLAKLEHFYRTSPLSINDVVVTPLNPGYSEEQYCSRGTLLHFASFRENVALVEWLLKTFKDVIDPSVSCRFILLDGGADAIYEDERYDNPVMPEEVTKSSKIKQLLRDARNNKPTVRPIDLPSKTGADRTSTGKRVPEEKLAGSSEIKQLLGDSKLTVQPIDVTNKTPLSPDIDNKSTINQPQPIDVTIKTPLSPDIDNNRTFSKSLFKQSYEHSSVPKYLFLVQGILHQFLHKYCEIKKIDSARCEDFFNTLIIEIHDNLTSKELVNDIPAVFASLWTSAKDLDGVEFCSMLNDAIRNDTIELIELTAQLCRGINSLCVVRKNIDQVEWPTDNLLYRGGCYPREEIESFFIEGKKYRAPMYLATSIDKSIAHGFCRKNAKAGLVPVTFVIEIDETYKCFHVNYISKSMVKREKEFLFVPYSVFEVMSVTLEDNGTWMEPSVVYLKAAVDNSLESENLPLSSWH